MAWSMIKRVETVLEFEERFANRNFPSNVADKNRGMGVFFESTAIIK